jgi:C-terminal processing protease CtpA/Prc
VFLPEANFAAQCAAPRSGFPDVQGSTLSENNWLRSWTNDLYLWYDEVVDRDPALFTTPAYFAQLKTSDTKDRFHFSMDTSAWVAFAQSGVSAGYGVEWAIVVRSPPRRIVVAMVEPNSPAAAANLARGAEVLMVDGVDAVFDGSQAGVATLNAGIFPTTSGETHTFTVHDPGAGTRTITMQSANVALTPVQNVRTITTSTGPVGYLLFNDHIATAESGLIDAVNKLNAAPGITDLVLDIRYNGGGFLSIASELGFMIAGPGPTAGRAFERIIFNRKHPTTDPVTGQPLTPTPFYTTTRGFSVASGQPLPTLNLPRVFVLTGPGTCSASESVINGLRGAGVQVIQVGSTTCGKPYGFYAQDNCGTTYFSIQFKGVNDAGIGDYADGFSPSNTVAAAGMLVPGCSVADDFAHALGDPNEARLAAALGYRTSLPSSCPAPSGFAMPGVKSSVQAVGVPEADGLMIKPPWRENRMLDQ